MTIQSLFSLNPVTPKGFAKAKQLEAPCPPLLYGVELEIEGVEDPDSWVVGGMTHTQDNSLRNHGAEFITKPMTYSNLVHCLSMFYNKNKPTEQNYSDRTSIHVHTNCQDLEPEHLQRICMLYQVFERLLFGFVGNGREDNIFCVPWHQTQLTYSILEKPGDISKFKAWQKYTGLNLLPLYEYGTIEWRHMHGHSDLQKLLDWLEIIGHIYRYALATPLKELQAELMLLNTNSLYMNLLFQVFRDKANLFVDLPGFTQKLEEGVLDMKLTMLPTTYKNQPKSTIKFTNDDLLMQIRRAQNIAAGDAFSDDWAPILNFTTPEGNRV